MARGSPQQRPPQQPSSQQTGSPHSAGPHQGYPHQNLNNGSNPNLPPPRTTGVPSQGTNQQMNQNPNIQMTPSQQRPPVYNSNSNDGVQRAPSSPMQGRPPSQLSVQPGGNMPNNNNMANPNNQNGPLRDSNYPPPPRQNTNGNMNPNNGNISVAGPSQPPVTSARPGRPSGDSRGLPSYNTQNSNGNNLPPRPTYEAFPQQQGPPSLGGGAPLNVGPPPSFANSGNNNSNNAPGPTRTPAPSISGRPSAPGGTGGRPPQSLSPGQAKASPQASPRSSVIMNNVPVITPKRDNPFANLPFHADNVKIFFTFIYSFRYLLHVTQFSLMTYYFFQKSFRIQFLTEDGYAFLQIAKASDTVEAIKNQISMNPESRITGELVKKLQFKICGAGFLSTFPYSVINFNFKSFLSFF